MTQFSYVPLMACGPILDTLQDTHFDDIKRSYRLVKAFETIMRKIPGHIVTGLFILKDDKDLILSIAVVCVTKLDRIYTFPSERNKGYAQKLLHEIVTFGIKNNILYYSPVEERIKELFIKANWIPATNKSNKDLTTDYCHKVFHKKLMKTYPETITAIDKPFLEALIALFSKH